MSKHDEARKAYEAAKKNLARLPKNAKESDYLKANKAVADAGKRLPWHLR
ncbi:hypothetical protein [Actinocatenispora sera]|nr:hypothetical protein [Actinocatenispora sera]